MVCESEGTLCSSYVQPRGVGSHAICRGSHATAVAFCAQERCRVAVAMHRGFGFLARVGLLTGRAVRLSVQTGQRSSGY